MSAKIVLTAAAFLLLSPAWLIEAAAGELDAAFEILRKGEPIGYHAVDVERTEGGYVANTRIEMKVRFGPIPVFRYSHAAREIWKGGALHALESRTNNNGERLEVRAWREGGALMVEGPAYRGPVPETAAPSTYWRRSVVEADILLSTQTGELIDIAVEALEPAPAPHDAPAQRFRLVGTVSLDLWYDGPRWVGSQFVVDGEELTYRLVESEAARRRIYAELE
ncbi:DUF6134 family protein [Amphiplicatus metriothermophilus]|uniref:DUF3108 domain-containing protein n=1 Tax=Amphiplicatus metriothermophilus TaxID=1519374 RepID=A0A239PSL9_9PROT|nr:DUF6134 family protein [Amphiplicatus metriothermophilus]MBB5519210.1 hypothetical protein [Amphiplicatus metriothermophilus]SNT73279.1 hypothetical protein SAMN06297382_1677 [Amphiplicatus metriothermophilus]